MRIISLQGCIHVRPREEYHGHIIQRVRKRYFYSAKLPLKRNLTMNTKYHQNAPTLKNYIWQPLIIFIFLTSTLILFFLLENAVNAVWAVGVGSLASTSYLVFAKPSATASHPFRFVVSYVIAIVCGLLMH